MDQMVVPAIGLPSPSVQVNAAPPHGWTSMPRCGLYQAWSAGASLALKKIPPMPVTRFMVPLGTGWGSVVPRSRSAYASYRFGPMPRHASGASYDAAAERVPSMAGIRECPYEQTTP